MKTLFLILTVTLAASAQELISADTATWHLVATGYPARGEKFKLYSTRPLGGKQYPVVRARKDTGPTRTVSLDCKAREFKVHGEDNGWLKAPKGSVGELLLRFACK